VPNYKKNKHRRLGIGNELPEPGFRIRLPQRGQAFKPTACAIPVQSKPSTVLPKSTQMKELNDEELMGQLQAGQGDALAVLFDRYHRLVLSIALKIVRDRGEAEDVMQNVFLEIFRAAAQFNPSKGNTKTWILQYAYHRSLNRRQHLATRHFYQETDVEDHLETHPSGNGSLLGKFSYPELAYLLRQGLARLNRQQRRVLELASYDGLSMSEIADKTGDSVSNVRHHYYRGLKKLRTVITGEKSSGKRDE